MNKTNFFLATCELKIGLYTDALKNIELFIRNPNAVEEWMSKAREMEANARFAIIALKNPIPKPLAVLPEILLAFSKRLSDGFSTRYSFA